MKTHGVVDPPTFLNDVDMPMTCPKCGSRTYFIERHDGQQLHWCMNDDCKNIFISEDDNDNI